MPKLEPLWKSGGYPPPLYTLSELALRNSSGGACRKDINVVVDGRKYHGNVFKRVCNTLRRVFVPDYWHKRTGSPGGT
jgi:hypothetical protein